MKHVTLDTVIAELQALREKVGGDAPVVMPDWVREVTPVGPIYEDRLGKGLRYTLVSRGGIPCVVISTALR